MSQRTGGSWAADVPVSQPEVSDRPVLVPFGGFGFTTGGLVIDMTEEEREAIFLPTFAPEGFEDG